MIKVTNQKLKNAVIEYEKKFCESFPVEYFRLMRELDFEGYSEDDLINTATDCVSANVKFMIHESNKTRYEIFLAEIGYKEKFGIGAPSFYVSDEERLSLLKESIKSGKPLKPNDNEESILF